MCYWCFWKWEINFDTTTLYNAFNLMLNKNKSRKVPKAFTGFKGTELIDKIIDIDQSPIGRTQDLIQRLTLVHLVL